VLFRSTDDTDCTRRPSLSRPTDRRRGVVPHVAHAGMALLLLGVAGTVSGETTTVPLRSGESVRVGDQVVHYRGVTATEDGDGRPAVAATVEVGGRTLHPSLVGYEERGELLAETSLISGPLRDVQVGLRRASVEDGQSNADAVATLQVGVHPLQVLVWWGALVVIAAGVALLLPRRPRLPSGVRPRPVPSSAGGTTRPA
jgi:cytochrome c biogenesis factor